VRAQVRSPKQMISRTSQPWTMQVPIMNRKRSRLALDDSDEDSLRAPEPSPARSTFSDALKKTKTQSDLDDVAIIAPEEAWSVDVDGILASRTLTTPPRSSLQAHDNVGRYKREESIVVLCVQGNVELHYDLLW
jgi:hypothetical protein